MSYRWTPEEDELIYRYGSQMPPKQLAELLTKRTGIPRSASAICDRRRRIDPAWDVDPVGLVGFHTVTGQGTCGTATNHGAMRQAIADGVLKRRWIGGYKRVFVPVEWAEEWNAKRDAALREYDRLRREGWYTTLEIADQIGANRKSMKMALLCNIEGMYKGFIGITKHVAHDGSYLWEPTQTRAAIAAVQRIKRAKMKPKGWWGPHRASQELNVHRKSLLPPAKWLLELGFDKVRVNKNEAKHPFWHPEDVIAFRTRHASLLDARRIASFKRRRRTKKGARHELD